MTNQEKAITKQKAFASQITEVLQEHQVDPEDIEKTLDFLCDVIDFVVDGND